MAPTENSSDESPSPATEGTAAAVPRPGVPATADGPTARTTKPPAPGAKGATVAAKPDYSKPPWAGKSSIEGEVAVELIVRGAVRMRVPLDLQAHDAFLIGRGPTVDVNLENLEPKASRFHCVLQCKENSKELFVYDMSTHGTMLNGKRLDRRTFVPMHIGEQLIFTQDKASCIAVLCGPVDAMVEESEVDLTKFKEQAFKDKQRLFQEQQEDLRRRKELKRQRMYQQARQDQIVNHLKAKAEAQLQERRQEEEQQRQKMHEVTWGMGEDAVEPAKDDVTEEAASLMDVENQLNCEKVRQRGLTEKQEQLVAKLEQRQRKLANLKRERERLGQRAAEGARRKKVDRETDFFDDIPDDAHLSQAAMEKLQGVDEKIQKVEEDLAEQTDNILLSLGLKTSGETKKLKRRREQMYDTRLDGDDDDFFDRTAVARSNAGPQKAKEDVDEEGDSMELAGLPTLQAVETKASLESKECLLKVERARLNAQLVAEELKEKQRAAARVVDEDSLDAFMGATLQELRDDRSSKIKHRLQATELRLSQVDRMLRVARRNADPEALSSGGGGSSSSSGSKSSPAAGSEGPTKPTEAAAAAIAAATATAACASEAGRRATPSNTKPAGAAAASSMAEALQRLREEGACEKNGSPDPRGQPDEDQANVVAAGSGTVAKEEPAAPEGAAKPRAMRGPMRPTPDTLAAARVAAAAPAAEEAAAPTKVAMPPPSTLPVRKTPLGQGAKMDLDKGGLQLMSSGAKRSADEAAMPPPMARPLKDGRKTYGVQLPPGGAAAAAAMAAAASRDANLAESGELDDPEE